LEGESVFLQKSYTSHLVKNLQLNMGLLSFSVLELIKYLLIYNIGKVLWKKREFIPIVLSTLLRDVR